MDSATVTEGIVEQSLQKILKKTGMGGILFLFGLGILLILAALVNIVLGARGELFFGFGDLGMFFLFLILGAAFIGFGVYRHKKRKNMKNDLYSSLIVCGTPEEARAIADAFNSEYLSAAKNPVLEKAGLLLTKNYVMTRSDAVGIAPRSSVLFAFQQGQPKNSSSDDTTFLIFCRYEPGLKEHGLPGVRVFGKPGIALLQAIQELGYPILPYNPTTDMKLIALAQDNYQAFERVIIERLGGR